MHASHMVIHRTVLRTKMQTMQQCTGHWNPFAGRRPALGHGVPGRRRARPALGHGSAGRRPKAGTGLHWGNGVPAEGRHWGTECPAEGRQHWPALGARRSAGLPAEGRRWLGRRPGTAARAVCARRSEQCAVYGARLSSMRTLYINAEAGWWTHFPRFQHITLSS